MEFEFMKTITAAFVVALATSFSLPAFAADSAACQASWTKMDAKKAGFVMSADMKDEMAMMTKAGRKTAAEDRMTDKEFMDACLADVFGASAGAKK